VVAGLSPGLLGLACTGLVMAGLLRHWLRAAGLTMMLLAIGIGMAERMPDVQVSGDGRTVAVRQPDGQWSIVQRTRNTTIANAWLRTDGDRRTAKDAEVAAGWHCDGGTCIATLPDGTFIAHTTAARDLPGTCAFARIVVAPYADLDACAAPVKLDRTHLRREGAVALWLEGEDIRVKTAGDGNGRRPWHRPMVAVPREDHPSRHPHDLDAHDP
jgi:competence protein ComEC